MMNERRLENAFHAASESADRLTLDLDDSNGHHVPRNGRIWQQGEAVWDKVSQGITALMSGSDGAGGYGRMPTNKAYESMEYNPPNSAVYRAWLARQPHGRTWDKWLLMALIGLCVGTVSFLLQQAIKVLFAAREKVGRYFLNWDMVGGYMLAWFFYVAVSAAFATGASFLVVKVAPAASASGVPGIMAFLNGVRVPKILNMWTFVVKFWSCALAVAAGLPIGPEGPIIHMGAFLGSAVSGLHSTTLRFDLGVFRHLRGSKHKRDFVTAGVAAGVAAAFDAPLGGLLFAFEEVASFWHSHLGWQVFFCCTMAVLVQNLLLSLDREIHNTGHFGFFSGNVTFKVGVEVYAHVLTIIPAAILGVVCGAAAILFTKLNLAIMRWRAAFIRPHDTHRIGEVLMMTLIYVGICMLLPHFFPCRETQCTVPRSMPGSEVRCSTSSTYSPTSHNGTITDTNEDLALTPDLFTCPYKINPDNQDEFIVYYNSMATLINPLGEDSVSRLFARGVHREFGYMTLLALLGWYFLGAAWAAGMDISSGMFVPMLLIGAVLGRVVGLLMVDLFPVDSTANWWLPAEDAQWKWIDPGVFAVVGAAAFMGGVTRLTVALAAIMMEVSSDVQMLLPVLVAILIAKAVADTFVPESYYHSVMEAGNVPFLPPNPHTPLDLDLVTVSAVMVSPVQTIPVGVRLQDLEGILRETAHNGYPVVAQKDHGLSCLGLIARNHLLVLLERCIHAGSTTDLGLSYPELNKEVEDPLSTHLSDESFETVLDAPLTMESAMHLHVPLSLLDHELDLSRFVDRSTYMVPQDFSLQRAYSLFTSMGLRHLVVVDDVNSVKGIITRENITPHILERLNSSSESL